MGLGGADVSTGRGSSGANLKSFVGCGSQTSRSESPVATLKARIPLPLQTSLGVGKCRSWLGGRGTPYRQN
ncbi:hypothetical protein BDM02DRAFT_3111189 [Thelephora ganbajun]|uniref:Uncharacterized protein n=1 Tax=Thelephora ganbajun TaxID=370292 RepID=A0ACB6ZNN7_THEGA|nr:hypothetical protein BDM02DRAFT_3111189 [Thelephora ganbajun]